MNLKKIIYRILLYLAVTVLIFHNSISKGRLSTSIMIFTTLILIFLPDYIVKLDIPKRSKWISIITISVIYLAVSYIIIGNDSKIAVNITLGLANIIHYLIYKNKLEPSSNNR